MMILKDKKVKCAPHSMGTCYSNAISIVPMTFVARFNESSKLITYDRKQHCEHQGTYDVITKEQSCFKEDSDGTGVPTNECGIDPW